MLYSEFLNGTDLPQNERAYALYEAVDKLYMASSCDTAKNSNGGSKCFTCSRGSFCEITRDNIDLGLYSKDDFYSFLRTNELLSETLFRWVNGEYSDQAGITLFNSMIKMRIIRNQTMELIAQIKDRAEKNPA